MERFADRREAGRRLGAKLRQEQISDPLILALPRGGVPVGYEVALMLNSPLDLLLVRKVGVPGQPELAMGAVGEGPVIIENDDVIAAAGISNSTFQRIAESELAQLEENSAGYRRLAPRHDPRGRVCVIVDDGLATGSTAIAAIEVLRRKDAAEVWVAVPVAPRDTVRLVSTLTARTVVLYQPFNFVAVGLWYQNFDQTTDDEVRKLLADAGLR